MLKILLVEDDTEKAENIIRILRFFEEIPPQLIEHVTNLQAARQRLRDTSYDLLILDIVVPNFSDSEPISSGGTQLLTEIQSRPDRYRTPAYIVGITQYEEMHTAASKTFQNSALVVVLYERNSDSWERTLKAAVRHLICARIGQMDALTKHDVDLVVVCALPMELQAVRNLPWNWSEIPPSLTGDPTAYFRGYFQKKSGAAKNVIAAAAAKDGNASGSSACDEDDCAVPSTYSGDDRDSSWRARESFARGCNHCGSCMGLRKRKMD